MSNSIHGTCPHCKADLDGDLVINYPLSQGKSREEALAYAALYYYYAALAAAAGQR